jgi:hypothetical protein
MRMMHVPLADLPCVVALAVCALCSACRSPAAPPDVAGVYALRSISGTIGPQETPVGGSLTLTPEGVAERRLSYRVDTTGTLNELSAIGTYQATDSLVALALRENAGASPYLWRVAAKRGPGGTLRLTHPRAADGTIVELYQRQ